jgi:hypothetical protein
VGTKVFTETLGYLVIAGYLLEKGKMLSFSQQYDRSSGRTLDMIAHLCTDADVQESRTLGMPSAR